MADYSAFEFDLFTTDEIARMMLDSALLGDTEFVAACRQEIMRRPTPSDPLPENQPGQSAD